MEEIHREKYIELLYDIYNLSTHKNYESIRYFDGSYIKQLQTLHHIHSFILIHKDELKPLSEYFLLPSVIENEHIKIVEKYHIKNFVEYITKSIYEYDNINILIDIAKERYNWNIYPMLLVEHFP